MSTFSELTTMIKGDSATIARQVAGYMKSYLGGSPLQSRVSAVNGRYPITEFHDNLDLMVQMGLVERVEVMDQAWHGTNFFWTQKAIEMHKQLTNEGYYPK